MHQSDQRRAPGHLSRQGPPALRWALYEAAQLASRAGSPDRAYYEQAAERLGDNRACLSLARKLLKRSYQCVTNAEGGVGVGDIVHRRCCARDGGLLALRRRPCGGRRQTALVLR